MHTTGSPRPLGPFILAITGVLLAMAIFWVGFMLAPAAVLLIFYLALSAGERARHQQRAASSEHEPAADAPGAGASTQSGPSGSSAQSGPGGFPAPRPGTQMGARRTAEAGVRREAQPPADSELVQAGSVSSQPRGART
jgi:hypothetical protein